MSVRSTLKNERDLQAGIGLIAKQCIENIKSTWLSSQWIENTEFKIIELNLVWVLILIEKKGNVK